MSLESRMEELKRYYDRRAPEYEALYQRTMPERNAELRRIEADLRGLATGRRVLEVACGTGYWTEILAGVADRVVATDVSREMLAVARLRDLAEDKVTFIESDAYALDNVDGDFDLGVANFWLSHVPKSKLADFFDVFHARLGPGALVFMTDNHHVAAYGGEFRSYPDEEDTYKYRELDDGSTWEVIKNYYSEDDLRAMVEPRGSALTIKSLEYYWWLWYEIA